MPSPESPTSLAMELDTLLASDERNMPMLLSRLGNRALVQFTHTGDVEDVDVAIRAFTHTLQILSDHEHLSEKVTMLSTLVTAYNFRFAGFQDVDDLTHIVNYSRRVANTVSDGGAAYNNLAMALQQRFDNLGNREDVDEAISYLQSATELATEQDGADLSLYLSNLSNALRTRFGHLDDMADLDAAIFFVSRAVELEDGNSSSLNNLGLCLFDRFERLGDEKDLEAAAGHLRRAVDLTADDEIYKSHYMHTLGTVLRDCYEQFSQMEHLNECIALLRDAVQLTKEHAIHQASLLSTLGNALCTRFEVLDSVEDIQAAIESLRSAVACTADHNPDKAAWLSNLAHAFSVSFIRSGAIRDVQEALVNYRQAVSLVDDSHPSLPLYLSNLGATLSAYAEMSGRMDDLDEAITLLKRSIQLAPDDHAEMPVWLDSLGIALHTRYREVQDLEDLQSSILTLQTAVQLTPPTHLRKAIRIHNLSTALFSRFERSHNATDIERVIAFLHEAIALHANGGVTAQATYLSALGLAYQSRFEQAGQLDDIDSAITYLEQALDRTPEGHADQAGWLSNLGMALISRHDRAGRDLNDLTRAIEVLSRTAELTPGGHAKQAIWHHNIAFAHQRRYDRLGHKEDFDAACIAYERAVSHVECSAFDRLHAALYWAELCSSDSPAAALPAYSHVISLIPSVAWLGHKIGTRYEQLPRLGSAISGAVAACFAVGDLERALEWLEQGRSVIWGQLLALRSPVDELRKLNPAMAKELEDVARALQNAGAATRAGLPSVEKLEGANPLSGTLDSEAQRHSQLAREYDRILARVHELPGLGNFLKPKGAKELVLAAADGPVVVINVHDTRSDALAVCPSGAIVHIPLPGLTIQLARRMREKLGMHLKVAGVRDRAFVLQNDVKCSQSMHGDDQPGWGHDRLTVLERILGALWIFVVHPIVSTLEDVLWHTARTRLPHITWCSAGALAALPIHAAGLYSGKVTMKATDFVVSSYTPSLSTLLDAIRRTKTQYASARPPHLLAITQANTPSHSPLPGTVEELRLLRTQFQSNLSVIRDAEATVSSVLGGMSAHSWVHLACHGMQVPHNPTESAFALHDGYLSIAELMRTELSRAQLAFLSACETATGDATLQDENIHLAAAMLAVGYRSVIGTSWSIGDNDAPVVAESFYTRLLGDIGGDGEEMSASVYALHGAIEQLKQKIGEKNFTRWVPFVHFGL